MDSSTQQRRLPVYRCVVNEDFDLRSFLLIVGLNSRGDLAFVSFSEVNISSQNGASQEQGTEESDKEATRVSLFFFLDRNRFGFQFIQDLHRV